MRRSLIATAALAALALCAFTLPGLAQDAVMKLNNAKAYAGGKQRGLVTFTHDKHIGFGYECTACHHKYDPKQPGKNLWTEATRPPAPPATPGPSPRPSWPCARATTSCAWVATRRPRRPSSATGRAPAPAATP